MVENANTGHQVLTTWSNVNQNQVKHSYNSVSSYKETIELINIEKLFDKIPKL